LYVWGSVEITHMFTTNVILDVIPNVIIDIILYLTPKLFSFGYFKFFDESISFNRYCFGAILS